MNDFREMVNFMSSVTNTAVSWPHFFGSAGNSGSILATKQAQKKCYNKETALTLETLEGLIKDIANVPTVYSCGVEIAMPWEFEKIYEKIKTFFINHPQLFEQHLSYSLKLEEKRWCASLLQVTVDQVGRFALKADGTVSGRKLILDMILENDPFDKSYFKFIYSRVIQHRCADFDPRFGPSDSPLQGYEIPKLIGFWDSKRKKVFEAITEMVIERGYDGKLWNAMHFAAGKCNSAYHTTSDALIHIQLKAGFAMHHLMNFYLHQQNSASTSCFRVLVYSGANLPNGIQGERLAAMQDAYRRREIEKVAFEQDNEIIKNKLVEYNIPKVLWGIINEYRQDDLRLRCIKNDPATATLELLEEN